MAIGKRHLIGSQEEVDALIREFEAPTPPETLLNLAASSFKQKHYTLVKILLGNIDPTTVQGTELLRYELGMKLLASKLPS